MKKKEQLSLFSPDESKFTPTSQEEELEKYIKEQRVCTEWLLHNPDAPSDQRKGALMGLEDWVLAEVLTRLKHKELVK